MPTAAELLTVPEIAAQLRVTGATVRAWIRAGRLPAIRAGARPRSAEQRWTAALVQHRIAPPDAGYARRLRDLADACEQQQVAYEYAATQDLGWDPPPVAAALNVPHELRTNSGRRGPRELWQRFDTAVDDLRTALAGISLAAIGRGFGELSLAARDLAQTVDQPRGGRQRLGR